MDCCRGYLRSLHATFRFLNTKAVLQVEEFNALGRFPQVESLRVL